MLNDIARRSQDDSWNSISFQVPGDQTHGLMADGSQRYEKRDIGLVLSATIEEFWSVGFHRSAMTVFSWCAIKVCANGTDSLVSNQLL